MNIPEKLILAILIAYCACSCSTTELRSAGKTVIALGEKVALNALDQWIEENSK